MKVSIIMNSTQDKEGFSFLMFRISLNGKSFKISVPGSRHQKNRSMELLLKRYPDLRRHPARTPYFNLKKSILEQSEDYAKINSIELTNIVFGFLIFCMIKLNIKYPYLQYIY